MDILVPPGLILRGLEAKLYEYLQREKDLSGIALLGFAFTKQQHHVDAVLILNPGIIVCLEAKNYGDVWAGNANKQWTSSKRCINSSGINPYDQCRTYSLAIKNNLEEALGYSFLVRSIVVAPSHASFRIDDAVINRIGSINAITIFNLYAINKLTRQVKVSPRDEEAFTQAGGVHGIVQLLLNISREELEQRLEAVSVDTARPKPAPPIRKKPTGNKEITPPGNLDNQLPLLPENPVTPDQPTNGWKTLRRLKTRTVALASIGVIGVVGAIGTGFWWKPHKNQETPAPQTQNQPISGTPISTNFPNSN
jgi:hypothetical protein